MKVWSQPNFVGILKQNIKNIPTNLFNIFKEDGNNFSYIAIVAHMSDIFVYLNELNLTLQRKFLTTFKVKDKVEAMIMKLDLWSERLQSGVFESFPTFCDFLLTSEENISEEIRNLFIQHLLDLKISFREYFPPCDANNKWI